MPGGVYEYDNFIDMERWETWMDPFISLIVATMEMIQSVQVVISDCKVEREKYDADDYHTNNNNDEDDDESDDVEEYDSDMDTTNVNEALFHLPISRNSVYANVVEKVTEAFEVQEVLMLDCGRVGMNDYKRIAVKLRDLVHCKCGIAMEASYPIRTGQKPLNPGPSPPSPVTPELVCDEYNTCPEATTCCCIYEYYGY
ncbi:low-temperature-induced cysteine proteinase-like protein [Tanacetum coccineum]